MSDLEKPQDVPGNPRGYLCSVPAALGRRTLSGRTLRLKKKSVSRVCANSRRDLGKAQYVPSYPRWSCDRIPVSRLMTPDRIPRSLSSRRSASFPANTAGSRISGFRRKRRSNARAAFIVKEKCQYYMGEQSWDLGNAITYLSRNPWTRRTRRTSPPRGLLRQRFRARRTRSFGRKTGSGYCLGRLCRSSLR